ncbi:Arc family DNA-binding protein [Sinorhizobium meliloti]|uniref:Arc family DNA-binding protein n=1 Tax=Rhizobium meliloti TaxID=382 RepID=UPI00028613FC|nr:Arc family DNA-binding protein [Sinorhizobium meliloti]ASP77402.1 Arc family DNA-binding protein [Sinorhizobium meliloti]MQW16853.1 Arc family DNA-binding protein [Sinorhizobium meliloti]QND27128.1 Arc family DNA-binding protein [Sinorhizobium meliloti]RMI22617.1 Arc family DNA-binding protein [Sinorhizobium meliloti]RVH91493.1 Arc family DNA-binding protein [Sinorhizobium meliloti]
MPAALKGELENAAREHNRSLTAEIVSRLEASLHLDEATPIKMTRKELFNLVKEVVKITEEGGLVTVPEEPGQSKNQR